MSTNIQKQRNKEFFISAAKKIVLEQGVENATVRNIADFAGFSYATIYNYFEDLNHLLWHVMLSYIHDVLHLLEKPLSQESFRLMDIKRIYTMYVKHFLKYPNVFRLIFFSDLGTPPPEFDQVSSAPRLAETLLRRLQDDSCKTISPQELKTLANIIRSSIQGMVTLHLSGKTKETSQALISNVEKLLDYLLLKAI
jgi:AcrR family transcriptional regulator